MDIETRNPMSEAEVILKSGMTPRDGSRVRCFRMDGTLVSGDINPGTTVIIGSRTPSKHRIGRLLTVQNAQSRWMFPMIRTSTQRAHPA